MTSVTIAKTGAPNTSQTKLTTLNQTDCYTANEGQKPLVTWIHVANSDNAGRTVHVVRYRASDTTDYDISGGAQTVPANDTLSFVDMQIQLQDGDIIKATAGTVDTITVTVTANEGPGQ